MAERIKRVNSLIARQLSKILNEFLAEKGFFFSIIDVETTSDLKETKVYISCQGKNLAEFIEPQRNEIQNQLNRRLVLKYVPRLKFVYEN